MARGTTVHSFKDGAYLAKCQQKTALSAAMNGHRSVWPEARMVIKNGMAVFYRDGQATWSCNQDYAAIHFDVSPL